MCVQDPFISAALGPNAKLERMRAASLRLGGQGLSTTHGDHLMIIGDAAGHIDPLTGACMYCYVVAMCMSISVCVRAYICLYIYVHV